MKGTSFKKTAFLLLILMCLYHLSLSQTSEYDKGYQKGYKAGYCYGVANYCYLPIIPLTPPLRITESLQNYQQGYNRGFQMGLDQQRINSYSNPSISPSYNFNYNNVEAFKSSDYIPPVNLSLLATVLARKQALFDSHFEWIEENFDRIEDLAYSILSGSKRIYYDSMMMFIDGYKSYLNSENRDYSDNRLFNEIKRYFRYNLEAVLSRYCFIVFQEQKSKK
jgi:hypothetical protein